MEIEKKISTKGRPRAFDADKALDSALDLFRRKGYEGTSLTDLTEAMGINRPSLYAAFGNKEELFQKALERYLGPATCFLNQCLSQPTAKAAIEMLMYGAAEVREGDCPRGCLLVKGALTGSEDSSAIQQELAAQRAANEVLIRKRLEQGKAEGELPEDCDPADLARYFSTIQQGLSVQAVGGATQEELTRIVKIALRAWPT
ncbi:TetR/AcrR family transcriptional regulator [bacterium]|nr:MAG: TetR/AcrR family transcriptional regulator [bacterium]